MDDSDGTAAVGADPSLDVLPDRTPASASPRTRKVSTMVAAAIVEDIVSQGHEAGARLAVEAAMVERFRVSRASVREGLRLLETHGVIDLRPGQRGGPVVRELVAGDLARTLTLFFRLTNATYRDVVEARIVIEPVMARLAAERQDADQLARLRELVEHPAERRNTMGSAQDFHDTMSSASGNPVLDILGKALRMVYAGHLQAENFFPADAAGGIADQHQDIADAIFAGDGPLTEQLVADHLRDYADLQDARTPWLMDKRVVWDA
ncbi:hypothetical protein GCM10009836_36950 [Pseudonocardia ailaonensis]|uniref:HTH gntR-type domain-containing protein n=1 Tax=Pseudonocardia ailaonensis TaxID=367279 RepID=A0ABN2N5I4_9PSEU